jgi:hypothetical protein
MIKFANHEKSLLGKADVWDQSGNRTERYIYSGSSIINELMRDDGMSHDEALEFVQYNMDGAYFGPSTPIIVWAVDE